jgi:drug/metabolite transporter (DMT)-like permease
MLQKITPFTLMFFTNSIFFLLILITSFFRQKEIQNDINKITIIDGCIIFLTAFITIFIANFIYYDLLKYHESSIISALISSSPIFTLLFAYLYFQEKVDTYGIIGIIFIVMGVIFISQNNVRKQILSKTNN